MIDIPEDTAKLHFEAAEEDLLSFTIHPSDGEAYTIIHDQGNYQLVNQPDYSLDMGMIRKMVDALLYLESTDTITSLQGLDLDEFGLSQSALRVTAHYSRSRQLEFAIGDRIPSDIPSDYLILTGDPLLYSVAVDVRETLDQKLNLLHTIPSVNFTADLLDAVYFDGMEAFSLHRVAQDIWEINEPIHYPARLDRVRQMLRQISQMRLAAYVDEALPENLAQYGLDHPRSQVRFMLSESLIMSVPAEASSPVIQKIEPQELVFSIGDGIPGMGFYCLYNHAVYLASDLSMGFLLEHDLLDYISIHPIDIPFIRLSQLNASWPQGKVSFDLLPVEHILPNNDIALDEQGNVLYEYMVTSMGRDIEPSIFIDAYEKLMAIKAVGALPAAYSASGQTAVLSLSLLFEGRERQIVFYPYDILHMAAEVNGHFAHYVSRKSVEDALSALSSASED